MENGANIVGATKASYTTSATTPVDNGAIFAVTVSNSAGSVITNDVTLTVTLTVLTLPPINHVFIVMEENHSYSEIISSGAMPYLQSLADQYGLATNYYANTHPSIGNYFMLTTGQIITNDDKYTSTVFDDNIVRHLLADGKTWREYTENLPSVGYLGGNVGGYVQHHNPLSYFSDVRNSTVQQQNLVPFTQLATDMVAGQLPNYGFIVPTNAHNGHDGTSLAADQWLQNNIVPLINDPQFQQDGLLLIIFDEGRTTDTANGGGQVVWVAVGPSVKTAYASDTLYQHQNTLKIVCDLLGIGSFSSPSLATDTAPSMTEFINLD
jgi:phosphatidylinositol-3-phosphatase